MKKFNVIEEGRLEKSEMAEVLGGDLMCVGEYFTMSACAATHCSCSGTYSSCASSGFLTCSGYAGQPGPGGIRIGGLSVNGGLSSVGMSIVDHSMPKTQAATLVYQRR